MAKMNRATVSTAGNERSSRSHAVIKLALIRRHAEKQEISVGSINLVDLAGSESPKTSTRMTETNNINRSLSELTNVILALLQKQDHIHAHVHQCVAVPRLLPGVRQVATLCRLRKLLQNGEGQAESLPQQQLDGQQQLAEHQQQQLR
ncbi:hypothetical protein KR009_004736 [Drosophila setifemur]|nr:hypothetical protein KR009_004736 [Drosophila setifemur]